MIAQLLTTTDAAYTLGDYTGSPSGEGLVLVLLGILMLLFVVRLGIKDKGE